MAQSQTRPKKWTQCEEFLKAVRSLPSHKCSSANEHKTRISFSIPNADDSEVAYIEYAAEQYDYDLRQGKGRISTRAGGNYVAEYVGE